MYHRSVSFLECLVLEAALHFNLSKYFFFAKAIKSLKMTSRLWALQSSEWKKKKGMYRLYLHLLKLGSSLSSPFTKRRQLYLLLWLYS